MASAFLNSLWLWAVRILPSMLAGLLHCELDMKSSVCMLLPRMQMESINFNAMLRKFLTFCTNTLLLTSSSNIDMYVCMHVCMYVYIYTYIYIYIWAYIYVQVVNNLRLALRVQSWRMGFDAHHKQEFLPSPLCSERLWILPRIMTILFLVIREV